MNKALFLDRDGVINEDVNYLCNIKDLRILPGVQETICYFKERGFFIIVITNQPAIGRGLITESGVEEIHSEINKRIGKLFDKFYFCPHHLHASLEKYRKECTCRKPNTGMLLQAAREFSLDLSQSIFVGDRISDVVAGKSAGCKTILINGVHSRKKIMGADYDINTEPDFVVNEIQEIKQVIKV